MGAAAILVGGLETPARAASGGQRATYVEARLDARSGQITGQVAVLFDNSTPAALDRVYFWLLLERLARPPRAMSDATTYWIHPRRFSPGSMTLEAARAGPPGREVALDAAALSPEPHAVAGQGALWSVRLPAPVAPGQTVRVVLSYRATVPERYGSLGCIDSVCALAGGFYPMVAALDEAGWDLDGPPMRSDMDVTVDLAQPGSAVLFDHVVGHLPVSKRDPTESEEDERLAEAAYPPAVRVHARRKNVPYAPLVVAPRLYQSTMETTVKLGAASREVALRFLSPKRPPPADDAHDQILPYTLENYARHGLEAASEAFDLLGYLSIDTSAREQILLEVPMRFDLELAAADVADEDLGDRGLERLDAGLGHGRGIDALGLDVVLADVPQRPVEDAQVQGVVVRRQARVLPEVAAPGLGRAIAEGRQAQGQGQRAAYDCGGGPGATTGPIARRHGTSLGQPRPRIHAQIELNETPRRAFVSSHRQTAACVR